jgi:hypothetical protein
LKRYTNIFLQKKPLIMPLVRKNSSSYTRESLLKEKDKYS